MCPGMGFICNPFYAFVISPSDQCTFSFRPIEMITIDCGSFLIFFPCDLLPDNQVEPPSFIVNLTYTCFMRKDNSNYPHMDMPIHAINVIENLRYLTATLIVVKV